MPNSTKDQMQDKPLSGDPEQRANDNRASREQSGLPPEEETREQQSGDRAKQGNEKAPRTA